jgi:hypothetical protein
MIFEDYCVRLIGLGEICEKLNRNVERFPPPVPNRKDENGLPHTWSKSVINAILRNPKYTGFNVWGRNDKRKGHPQIRPRDQWVWSAEPTHEPIVSRELFDQVEEGAQTNARASKAGMPRSADKAQRPKAQRLYPLRARVPLRHVWAPHGGLASARHELVSLPVRVSARPGGGYLDRPPEGSQRQGGQAA